MKGGHLPESGLCAFKDAFGVWVRLRGWLSGSDDVDDVDIVVVVTKYAVSDETRKMHYSKYDYMFNKDSHPNHEVYPRLSNSSTQQRMIMIIISIVNATIVIASTKGVKEWTLAYSVSPQFH